MPQTSISDGPQQGVPHKRKSKFGALGWVLLLATAMTVIGFGMRLWDVVEGHNAHGPGDGKNVDSYEFTLDPLLVPKKLLAAAGVPKDSMQPYVDPKFISIDQVKPINEGMRGKWLVPDDRVIGVEINGVTRAYPIRMLNWHEIANDTVGGVPIAVTYNPLCDSAVVFDRRVGGETLEFGHSGLLFNSNLLMYDRRDDVAQESLWSQLEFRAIAGPAAADGKTLKVLPCALARLGDWQAWHPESELLAFDVYELENYKANPVGNYLGSDKLRYTVEPLPKDGHLKKTRTIAVRTGPDASWHVFSMESLEKKVGPGNTETIDIDGKPFSFLFREFPPTAVVEREDKSLPYETAYSFWFAWYAMHPDAELE